MGLRPTRVDENASVPATTFYLPLPFPLSSRPPRRAVGPKRSGAEGSAVLRIFRGNVFRQCEPDLQSAPPATYLRWKHHLPLVIPTGAKRSGGTCGSTEFSWKCFS